MNKEIKVSLIVCDMDGTLFANDKTIPEANKAAILKARKQGIRFSVCTGRIQPMIEYYLKDLALDTPVITANGALIWDPVKKEILWDLPMNKEEVLDVLWFCREHELDYCALTMEKSYFSPHNARRWRFEQYNRIASENGFYQMDLGEFDEDFACVKDKHVYKLLIHETAEGQMDLARNYLDTLKETGYTSSERGLLDIAHKDVNKGYGLIKLADILEIPMEKVCAMGDYDNDIPMLEACGYPVAMGNGCTSIKEKAAFVTKTNEEGGVAWAMEQWLHI